MAKRKNAPLDAATIRIFVEMAVLLIAVIVLFVLIFNINASTGANREEPIETTDNTLPSVETVPGDAAPRLRAITPRL